MLFLRGALHRLSAHCNVGTNYAVELTEASEDKVSRSRSQHVFNINYIHIIKRTYIIIIIIIMILILSQLSLYHSSLYTQVDTVFYFVSLNLFVKSFYFDELTVKRYYK